MKFKQLAENARDETARMREMITRRRRTDAPADTAERPEATATTTVNEGGPAVDLPEGETPRP